MSIQDQESTIMRNPTKSTQVAVLLSGCIVALGVSSAQAQHRGSRGGLQGGMGGAGGFRGGMGGMGSPQMGGMARPGYPGGMMRNGLSGSHMGTGGSHMGTGRPGYP